ncbi:MAG: SprT family zinc-dependent metalloprotease, partial [Nitrospinota bacterium]
MILNPMAPDSSRLAFVSRVFHKLNREHFRSSIPTPKIRLSRRMTASAGSVQYRQGRNTLTISIPYHDHHGWDGELVSTLKHEMIHLYLDRYLGIQGHGKVFSALCEAIGTERFCKEIPRERPVFVYACPRCGAEYRYRKKVRLYCGICRNGSRPGATRLRLIRKTSPPPDPLPEEKALPRPAAGPAPIGRQLTLPGLEMDRL